MRTYLEIGGNLLLATLFGCIVCTYLVTGTVSADPIMEIIDWNQTKESWCRQRVGTEVEIAKCIFNSQ